MPVFVRGLGLALLATVLAACSSGPAPTPAATAVAVATTAAPTAAPPTSASTLAPPTSAPPTLAATAAPPTLAPSATRAPTVAPTRLPGAVADVAPGVIFYLDPDGKTIKTIRGDGSDQQTLITLEPGEGEEVTGLQAEATGHFLLYGLGSFYSLIERGETQPITYFVGMPRWAPDNRRLAGQLFSPPETPGELYIYDAVSRTGQALGVIGGQPDWFPDGQRLVYVSDGNVWAYDLATSKATAVTTLPTAADATWLVSDPHVVALTDAAGTAAPYVMFFGSDSHDLGLTGNGQRWWTVPAGGGTPQPFTDPGGNYVVDYAQSPARSWFSYVDNAHNSICVSDQQLICCPTSSTVAPC